MICFHPSPEERQSEQQVLLSICEVELEKESNREREQHTRGPLLISSSLQTNDNESRQYSRIIMLQKKSQHLPCSPQLECKTRRGHNKSVATGPVCPWLTERNIIEISLLSHFRRKTVTCPGECDTSAQNLRCGIGRGE